MKNILFKLVVVSLLCVATSSFASTTWYVATNSATDGPGTDWNNAFHTIQQAVDASTDSDLVLVTNGLYDVGGRAASGYATTNRVVIDKVITVKSVNGSSSTIIKGAGPLGNGAVRCAYVRDDAVLEGFTLTNGYAIITGNTSDQCGGGAYCRPGGTIAGCHITGNFAHHDGGGIYGGVINNCIIDYNVANHDGGGVYGAHLTGGIINDCYIYYNRANHNGGGVYDGTLYGCLVTENSATNSGGGLYNCIVNKSHILENHSAVNGGGAYLGEIRNSNIYYNNSNSGGGVHSVDIIGCTVRRNHADYRGGGTYYGSCVNSIMWNNTASSGGSNVWYSSASFCCIPKPVSGTGNITNDPQCISAGKVKLLKTSPCIDAGNNSQVADSYDIYRNPRISDGNVDGTAIVDMGCYEYSETIWYAATNSASDGPGTDWNNAFHTIQQAVNVASNGDYVLVASGVYEVGGKAVYGNMTNRVAIDKEVTVRGLDAATTIIKGVGPNGNGAVRCVYVGTNAVLDGFSLINGHTKKTGDTAKERSGGGAWCEHSGIITNCLISNNSAWSLAGGVFSGSIIDSTISLNFCSGGYGGGLFSSIVKYCYITDNFAHNGGGIYGGSADNCLLTGNQAVFGGGVVNAALSNCTLSDNYASNIGGGIIDGTATNCIIWGNTAATLSNNWASASLSYCCTEPLPAGIGNISTDPLFLGIEDFYLESTSSAVDAGNDGAVQSSVDLDGNQRMLDGSGNHLPVVDMGCYEMNTAPYIWYVAINSVTDGPGYTWGNAFHTIQNAVNAANNIDSVLVSNGVYNTGTLNVYNIGWVRVAVEKPISISSVNGPDVTVIDGTNDVRSIYLGVNSSLTGFTITSGRADASGESGGGVYCANSDVIVSECIISNNVAGYRGGGAYRGFFRNCSFINNNAKYGGGIAYAETTNGVLSGNSASYGGGAYRGTIFSSVITNNFAGYGGGVNYSQLDFCTIVNNTATNGGGAYNSTARNCIIDNNSATNYGGGVYGTSMESCLVTANSASEGGGTYNSSPDNCTITENSATVQAGGTSSGSIKNCIVWGNSAPDYINYYSGNIEYSCTMPLAPGDGNIDKNPQLLDDSNYHIAIYSPCLDAGDNAYIYTDYDLDGKNRIIDSNDNGSPDTEMGCYEVNVLRVNKHSFTSGPGNMWGNAYHTIQEAIDDAMGYDLVLVADGVYDSGGRVMADSLMSRVGIYKPLTVKSVNGATSTIIKGNGPTGPSAIRGVYVDSGAFLAGFTVSNGHTRTVGDLIKEKSGGGILNYGTVYNCILTDNVAYYGGGGIAYNTIYNSVIKNNSADYGGGANGATLKNCTVKDNFANKKGGGTASCTINSSIIVDNTATGPETNYFSGNMNYSCTIPIAPGTGNITNNPQFVSADNLQLASSSPCIDSGNIYYKNEVTDVELAGIFRILDGNADSTNIVDMGAYEYVNANADSDADGMPDPWELQHGLNPTYSADSTIDNDYDFANNGEEYIADTDPNDSNSYFCVTAISNGAPITVYFKSSLNREYTLKSCSNLVSGIWQDVAGSGPRAGVGGDDSMQGLGSSSTSQCYKVSVQLLP